MKLDRKMIFLNGAFLMALGAGFAIKAAPLPAYAPGRPWEALASERLLGMTLGGVGLALWFLRRLTQPADFKRLTLGWLLINLYASLLILAGISAVADFPALQSLPRLPKDWGIWAAALVHLALLIGCCATVAWRKGAEFRRIFRLLLLAEATLATLMGYGFVAAARSRSLSWSPGATIRLLGAELAGFALALIILGNPANGDDRRRLLLGLGAGNALTAATTLFELNVWGFESRWAWGLVLAQVALAVGSVWAELRPERARSQPTMRALASRLTWSHLLAGVAAGSLMLAAPALSLPSWAALILTILLALGVGALFAGDLQRILLDPIELATMGRVFAVPGSELDEAARQTWLRQVTEAAAQEERNRLARDLHDSIKQQLFSINVGTAAAQERWERDPEGARKALADVRRSAREAMVEMQAMLHQLRPEALGTAGLIEALREQCEALGYRTGAEVTLELGDPVPDERLPPGAQETLFRIAQEALANVARHARARRVRVRLGCEGEAVRLQVEDDGQGFDPGTGSTGMGLRNLRERTESLNGHLEVASVPGEGTRISIQVPFTSTPAPPTFERLAKALRYERWDRLLSPLVVALFLEIPDNFSKALLVSLALTQEASKEWQVRSVLRRFPGAAPQDLSRLRYLSFRNRAVMLLGAAWGACRVFFMSGGPAWMFTACLCLALAAFEMVRLHRWSRPCSWPSWAWPAGWERSGGSVAFLVGIALALMVPLTTGGLGLLLWLRPEQAGLLALSVAALIYFLWRRPRTEGALHEP